jgi:hypothetical protein
VAYLSCVHFFALASRLRSLSHRCWGGLIKKDFPSAAPVPERSAHSTVAQSGATKPHVGAGRGEESLAEDGGDLALPRQPPPQRRGRRAAQRRWEVPRPVISAKRFRRLVRRRSLAVARLAGEEPPPRPASPAPSSSGEEAGEEHQGQLQDDGQQQGQQQQQAEEGEVEQQQAEEVEEQEEGAVEDADMNYAGEVVVEADGNGAAEEGQERAKVLTRTRR